MANKDNSRTPEDHDLDRVIDAALEKYASVEPRAGLQERILASLGAADRNKRGAWWMWGVAAVLAAVVLVAGTLVWRSRITHPPVAIRPSSTQQTPRVPEFAQGERMPPPVKRPLRGGGRSVARHETVAANPKLNVFPSPLPLSEQERLLAIYVGQFPEHAALVAEARMDDLRQEAEVRRKIAEDKRDQKQ